MTRLRATVQGAGVLPIPALDQFEALPADIGAAGAIYTNVCFRLYTFGSGQCAVGPGADNLGAG